MSWFNGTTAHRLENSGIYPFSVSSENPLSSNEHMSVDTAPEW